MADINPRYWIGVASKDHVENGVKLGICQFCHGKSTPAKRLSKGDFVILGLTQIRFCKNMLGIKFFGDASVI